MVCEDINALLLFIGYQIAPLRSDTEKFQLFAFIGVWCNGNTADFGSVILSSSLGGSTEKGGPVWNLPSLLVGTFVECS